MNYILGVDGGGTNTEVRIATVSGDKIAEAVSGSSSYKSVGISKAIENLNSGVFKAIKKVKSPEDIYFISSCLGFAGNNTEEDKKIYTGIVFNNKLTGYLDQQKTVICNDTIIGLEAGSKKKNKIIIIAGSGSNCLGVNEDGKQVKVSGWDYILADEGSGYQTGLKALKAVMKAYDGRGEKTLLSGTILEELNLKDILDLSKWAYDMPFSKDRISALSKTVCMTAQMGDRISIDILTEEVEEVVISVTTVADKLGFKNKDFDLVFVGGMFKCKKHFKDPVISRLKSEFTGINFLPLLTDPVEGAIKIAIERLKDF
jgi:N-acetylglucosamine kinase-like BadF-type ATPase